jgi:hypothetical protein
MTFQDIIRSLSCTLIVPGAAFDTAQVKSVVASDLMSDVLTTNEENFILSTSLNSEQVVRTADIVGALGIVLVNGKQPQDGLKKLARDHGLTVLSTPETCFRACYVLGTFLEKEKAGLS